MAERRMFAKTIIDSDAFLEMPQSSQLLYFHLSMRADDEGFINKPKTVMRMVGSKDDDMSILIVKKFIIPFESGIVVIKHWRIHNYLQNDRLTATKYQDEKQLLEFDDNKAYRLKNDQCIQNTGEMYTQVRLGKDRLVKDIKEGSRFAPPTLEEVMEYAKEKNQTDIAKKFYDYYSTGDWKDAKGNKVKNWKQKFITWSGRQNNGRQRVEPLPDYDLPEVKLSSEEMEGIKARLKAIK